MVKSRGVPAKDLTLQDVSICFFPEQPKKKQQENDTVVEAPKNVMIVEALPHLDPASNEFMLRERWKSRLIYLLSFVAFTISFNNIYYFPLLLHQFGGAGFLIPYTLFTIIFGYPLHFLQTSFGQYGQVGIIKIWDCAPIARGIGFAILLLCILVCIYYNLHASYALVYLSRCFNKVLPWIDCQDFNSERYRCVPRICNVREENQLTPSEYYFYQNILDIETDDDPVLSTGFGLIKWWLVLALFFAWLCVYVITIQGVRSIGKAAIFFVIFPYFCLLMLLSVGLQLEGTKRSLTEMFSGGLKNLASLEVWITAAIQVFIELGIAFGVPLVYGSFCYHKNPVQFDSLYLCFINYFTSILCGLVTFCILGSLSNEFNTDLFVNHSISGIYTIYTEALIRIPGAHLWCIIFFLMLFSIVISTVVAIFFVISTVLFDEFYNLLPHRWLIHLLFCISFFLLGLIFCTSKGFFVIHLLHFLPVIRTVLPIILFFSIILIFIYGLRKYCDHVHFMTTDYYPLIIVRIFLIVTPFILFIFVIGNFVIMKRLKVENKFYANYAEIGGWTIFAIIILVIPLFMCYWIGYCCTKQRLKYVFSPLNSWDLNRYGSEIVSDKANNRFTSSWWSANKNY